LVNLFPSKHNSRDAASGLHVAGWDGPAAFL
jgi:hypothetical protein